MFPLSPASSEQQPVHRPLARPVLLTFHGHFPEPAGLNERIDDCLRPGSALLLRVNLPPSQVAR